MIFVYLQAPTGNASVFLSLAKTLQEQGHKVDVYTYYFSPEHCFPELTKSLDITFVKKMRSLPSLQINTLKSRLMAGLDFYVFSKRIAPLMEDKQYDLIYCSESCSYVPALQYVKAHPTPIIWSVFDPITLVDDKKPDSLVNKFWWFKQILSLHARYDAHLLSKVHKIIVPTTKMKRKIDDLYKISAHVFPTAGIHTLTRAKTQKLRAQKRLKEKFNFIKQKNEVLFFTHAHFQPHRRFEDILQAVSILKKRNKKSIKLIVSGSKEFDEKYYQSILDLRDQLKLVNEVMIDSDFKTTDELYGYYQMSDAFIFVPVEQTWGLVPFEAMNFQVPTILSTGVGAHEVFTDQENCYIIQSKSPKDLAEVMGNLIENPKIARKIGRAGKHFVQKNFTYTVIARKLASFFEEQINPLLKR